MKRSIKLLSFGVLVLAVASCGKRKTKEEVAAAVVGADPAPEQVAPGANQVSLAGRLNLTVGNLAGESRSLLMFKLLGSGDVEGKPEQIAVAADGSFRIVLDRFNSAADKAKQALKADGSVDRSTAKELFPDHAAEIDAMSDAELVEGLSEQIQKMERAGNYRYMLISYVKSGDVEAEAASMQFIGMPTAAGNLRLLPAEAFKGNTELGDIAGSGDEATAATAASTSFDLPAQVLEELAGVSQTLKILKNQWLNSEKNAAEVTPWFGFTSSDFTGVINQFGTPANLSFMGGGLYMQARNLGATFGEICPVNPADASDVSGNGYAATPAKLVEWVPPEDLTVSSVVYGPSHPFSNTSSQYRRQTQYSEIACSAASSDSFLYVRAKAEADTEFQMQIGSGFAGSPVQGLWKLKVAGEVVGRWDISAAKPMDSEGHPVIYIPAYKVTVNGQGVATKVEVKFFIYNKALAAFREVTDTKGLDAMVSSIGIDLSYSGGSHPSGDFHQELVADGNGLFHVDIGAADQAYFNCQGYSGGLCVNNMGLSYIIGPVSYRLELRPAGSWTSAN